MRPFFRLPITKLISRGCGGVEVVDRNHSATFLYPPRTIWPQPGNRNQSRNLNNKRLSSSWMTSTLSQRRLSQPSQSKGAENSQKRPVMRLRSSHSSTKSPRRARNPLAPLLRYSSGHVLQLLSGGPLKGLSSEDPPPLRPVPSPNLLPKRVHHPLLFNKKSNRPLAVEVGALVDGVITSGQARLLRYSRLDLL